MISNVLLTGGTGFLGSHILKNLLKNKYKVTVLARHTSDLYRIEHLRKNFELFYIEADLRNLSDLFFNKKIDTIIHTATEYGRDCSMSSILQTNLIFPLKLIEEGIKNDLKCFINTDTFSSKSQFMDSSYLHQYNKSKKYLLDYLFEFKNVIKVVNMRLEHIYGENDSENKFVTTVLKQLIQNDKEILLSEGQQKRDFIYIEDVVSAYNKVLINNEKLSDFTEFGIGRGESITVRQFVELLRDIIQSKSELKFGALPKRKGEIQDSVADVKGLSAFGWKPTFVLKSALRQMVEIEKKKYLFDV